MSYQTMVSCDDVFDRLTQGPFPGPTVARTEEQNDVAVQRHIDACHECRMLAEGLRPAVSWIHESLEAPAVAALPSYRSLGEASKVDSDRDKHTERRVSERANQQPWLHNSVQKNRKARGSRSPFSFLQGLSLLVLSVAFAAVMAGLFQQVVQVDNRDTSSLALAAPLSDGTPSAEGIAILERLGIQPVCFEPQNANAESAANDHQNFEEAVFVAATSGEHEHSSEAGSRFHCCTDCHQASAAKEKSVEVSATLMAQSCAVCHLE